LTEEEQIAFLSTAAIGLVGDEVRVKHQFQPVLDNQYFKQVAKGNDELPFAQVVKKNNDILQKFAQDNKAFKEAYGKAFIKLSEWGHNDLTELSELATQHTDFKLHCKEY